jgi:hypothetical protein
MFYTTQVEPEMQLPNLPNHFQPDARLCLYGYDVSEEWLVQHSRTYMNPVRIAGNTDLLYGGLQLLKAQTGINVTYKRACEDSKYSTTGTVIRSIEGGPSFVPILTICTTQSRSYHKRPKQSQVDQLSQFVGKQPKWWVDFEDPAWYALRK